VEIARDWRELQDYYREHDRDPSECAVAHENFMHIVLTSDPDKARREQHEAFLRVMSSERGPKYLETVYLFGTPDEIVASLQLRVDAGVEYFMLHTMTPDPAQLQSWIGEIIANVKFPPTAGPVRRMAAAAVASAA
jgi:alkanesulfonate monooxygenase SsuD/methylene tetrahydromethanopterin reductase-like flavin-dependent oxidoreductase (luciferase family)